MSNPLEDFFGESVITYTRAQAIEDGVLVDLTPIMEEKNMKVFKHPTACSIAVWDSCIAWGQEDPAQDIAGRLWDVLTNALHGIKTNHDPSARYVHFSVIALGLDGERKDHYLKIHCGPGDTAAPVMTIMMEEED